MSAFGAIAWLAALVAAGAGTAFVCDRGSPEGLASYDAEAQAAMLIMMARMAARPTGDPDRDFVAAMIPHHQGAIDMAVAMLWHGRNPKLLRIAQGIIVEQQQEIVAMQMALSASAPKQSSASGRSNGPEPRVIGRTP